MSNHCKAIQYLCMKEKALLNWIGTLYDNCIAWFNAPIKFHLVKESTVKNKMQYNYNNNNQFTILRAGNFLLNLYIQVDQ